MDIFLLPLTNTPQRFEIELDGRLFILQCVWNEEAPAWMLDLYDAETGEALFRSAPLVAGVDILKPYAYLGIKGQLFVYTDGAESEPPTLRPDISTAWRCVTPFSFSCRPLSSPA